MSTGKAIVIVGGVAVGAYVLLQLVGKATPAAAAAPKANNELAFIGGLVNVGARIFEDYRSKSDPNEGIDPSTGGVTLAPGQVYGPVLA